MTPLEQFLYRQLISSKGFNRFVQKIYNRVNNIKEPMQVVEGYVPTLWHKVNAFRIVWMFELRDTFRFRK